MIEYLRTTGEFPSSRSGKGAVNAWLQVSRARPAIPFWRIPLPHGLIGGKGSLDTWRALVVWYKVFVSLTNSRTQRPASVVLGREERLTKFSLVFLLSTGLVAASVTAVVAQPTQAQPGSTSEVTYQAVAEGVQEARIFGTDVLRDVRIEVKDFIFGPGKSAPKLSTDGFVITELKSGELETVIDGQSTRRRPGEFWLVQPGQSYAIRNMGGMAVLHAIVMTRK